jgi:hypothetical protein
MLYALIAIAWFAVSALLLAICTMAKRADGELPATAARAPDSSETGVVIWEGLPEMTVRDSRTAARRDADALATRGTTR